MRPQNSSGLSTMNAAAEVFIPLSQVASEDAAAMTSKPRSEPGGTPHTSRGDAVGSLSDASAGVIADGAVIDFSSAVEAIGSGDSASSKTPNVGRNSCVWDGGAVTIVNVREVKSMRDRPTCSAVKAFRLDDSWIGYGPGLGSSSVVVGTAST